MSVTVPALPVSGRENGAGAVRVLLVSGQESNGVAPCSLQVSGQQRDAARRRAAESTAGIGSLSVSGRRRDAARRYAAASTAGAGSLSVSGRRRDAAAGRAPDDGKEPASAGGAERVTDGEEHAGEPILLRCEAGWSLSETVFLSGLIPAPALCAGHALCGRCRVRMLAVPGAELPPPLPAELRRLSTEELAQGFRLACRHSAEAGMLLEIPTPEGSRQAQSREAAPRQAAETPVAVHTEAQIGPRRPSPDAGRGRNRDSSDNTQALPSTDAEHGRHLGPSDKAQRPPSPDAVHVARGAYCDLALDLGTTALHWRLLAPAGKETPAPAPGEKRQGEGQREILREGVCANPQAGAGSDVVSRLAFARKTGGGDTLRALILNALRDIVRESRHCAAAAGYADVGRICVAGNPIMTALLLGRKISGSAHAPEFPAVPGEENIPGLPPLVIPPQLSSFVGGDVAAGYAALALDPDGETPKFPFLLADMGTNGEFLLALSPDAALTSSVALGPALEGAGLYSGVEACPGAAADFLLEADGLKALVLSEDFTRPGAGLRKAGRNERLPGMTGTACLALLHILRGCGVMSREGFFTAESAGSAGRFFPLRRDAGGERFLVPGYGLRLYASDVESVLKVKAAFNLGMERLLDAAGLAFSDLAVLYSAGSLGSHVRKDALEGLGFIPPGSGERLRAPGNTSLEGAALLLRRPETLEELTRRAKGMRTVDLAADPGFARAFAASMHF